MAKRPHEKRHFTGVALLLVVVAGAGALLYAALTPQPIIVETGEVTRGPMQIAVREDGQTRVIERYVVSAPLAGNLARPQLQAGDDVEEGGVVARLMPLSPALLDQRARLQAQARVAAAAANEKRAAAEIARAEAAQHFARETLTRFENLREDGHVVPTELDRARMDARTAAEALNAARFTARVARYELRMAEAALGSLSAPPGSGGENVLEVTSPIDGRVLRVLRESEGVVTPGTPLLELGDLTELEAVVDVLSEDAVRIPLGAPARVVRWGGEEPLRARVRTKEPSAFTTHSALGVEEQRVRVVLDLLDPQAQRAPLGDGYRIEAEIQVWHADDVVRVPASAVFRHDDGWAAFVVREGVAHLQPFDAGRHGPDVVEVRSGLAAGAQVILYPSDAILDGTAVAPR